MSDLNTTTKRTAGRPKATINWPSDPFTVDSLKVTTGLSKVTLYIKVKKAVEAGLLIPSSKENSGQGRPRTLFKLKQLGNTPVAIAA